MSSQCLVDFLFAELILNYMRCVISNVVRNLICIRWISRFISFHSK